MCDRGGIPPKAEDRHVAYPTVLRCREATSGTGGHRRPFCKTRSPKDDESELARAILQNVPEYAKPRRCFQHKLSLSDNPILPVLAYDFKKRGLGEENSDTFENTKIYRYFLNRILGVIRCFAKQIITLSFEPFWNFLAAYAWLFGLVVIWCNV